MSDRGETGHCPDVLEESLARLAATGPEFGGGLSNHGPMAAEAMIQLGRPDYVQPWLDRYIRRLEEPPRAADRVTDRTWRDVLGARRRVADWELYLRDQLADQPWQQVLARWWPRLVPGLAANATHGIIRTSHAAAGLAPPHRDRAIRLPGPCCRPAPHRRERPGAAAEARVPGRAGYYPGHYRLSSRKTKNSRGPADGEGPGPRWRAWSR
jgi:hypothetical protein